MPKGRTAGGKTDDPKPAGAKKGSSKEPNKKSSASGKESQSAKKASTAVSAAGSVKKPRGGGAVEAVKPSAAEAKQASSQAVLPAKPQAAGKAVSASTGSDSIPPQPQPPPETPRPAPPEEASTGSTPTAPELETVPPDEIDGIRLPASRGKATIFGGPKDRSRKPDDKLGLPTGLHFQYERARSLNPKAYYCSMRWEFRQQHMSTEEGKRWWANKKLLVSNPAGGAAVVVKAVDYGPHENTGLVIGISPAAADAIGVEAGQEVDIKFADQKAQLGPVQPL
jgi:hypothetical protein